jgi:hypothetical protein
MSIGIGLFLSTLAVIAAVLIERRHAWKKAGKVTAWTMGIAVLVGGGIIGYVYTSDYYQRGRKKLKEPRKQRRYASEV